MNTEVIKGKKLLILAGGPYLITLVERAKELGVYTIVTDYYDTETSPAKLVADEYWDISWEDLDTLEKKCREEHIDGITTGYSESPVDCCIKLCDRLGLPCYCTQDQLDFTRDKIRFKEVCRRNGVPVVKEYSSIDEVDEFPVIMKPVDRAGSIGVGVATCKEELKPVYDYAMEMSYSKHVIIEKYITGIKVDVYYEIRDGKINLLSTSSSIFGKDNGFERVVQSAWYLPAHAHDLIVKEADPALRRMIADLGIKNGYIFISGFEDAGKLVFFETGFRLCGGHLYNYYVDLGHVNNLDIFIYHALTGSTKDVPVPTKGDKNMKCMTVNIYVKGGTIGKIDGFEEIGAMEDCRFTSITGHVGQKCRDDKAILDKVGMFYFCSPSAEKLQQDTEEAYKLLKVVDVEGNDMIYDRIDTSVISHLWDK